MNTLRVEKQSDGQYGVVDGEGAVLASDLSHAGAWRFVDRADGEALNKSQDKADWFFRTVVVGNHFDREGRKSSLRGQSLRVGGRANGRNVTLRIRGNAAL